MANGSNNARFLSKLDSKSKSMILENIAKHYGISVQDALDEVTDAEAEHLLEYMVEPARSAASVLMQRHGMRGFSRPGAKDMMAVEDRFYFGKGRKERFASDEAYLDHADHAVAVAEDRVDRMEKRLQSLKKAIKAANDALRAAQSRKPGTVQNAVKLADYVKAMTEQIKT